MFSLIKKTIFKKYAKRKDHPQVESWNQIIDKAVKSVTDSEISAIDVRILDSETKTFKNFLKKGKLNDYLELDYSHKKALEFFFSYVLLKPEKNDTLLDAAGGSSEFVDAIARIVDCKCYLHDHIYEDTMKQRGGINVIGGDISRILLPDCSVSKITCHHSFEHFHEDKDSRFIQEIGRILKPGGKSVIIPVFIAQNYFEVWNMKTTKNFDPDAIQLIDETASLPGSEDTGYFARIYDEDALQRRVLNVASKIGLKAKLYTCLLDGIQTPDMDKNHGASINYPMRALHLTKHGHETPCL